MVLSIEERVFIRAQRLSERNVLRPDMLPSNESKILINSLVFKTVYVASEKEAATADYRVFIIMTFEKEKSENKITVAYPG
jgi:hypothetical protein